MFSSHRFAFAFAMLSAGCLRPVTVAQPHPNTVAIEDEHYASSDSGPLQTLVAEDANNDSAMRLATVGMEVPALFASANCDLGRLSDGSMQRMYNGEFITFHEQHLTSEEIRVRPWLWGQERSGCILQSTTPGANERETAVLRGATAARVAAIAREYLRWGRVDDEVRWAPELCRMPLGSRPRGDVGEHAPHGRKVYFLFAKQRDAYLAKQPVNDQIIVKEAWRPREIAVSDAILASGQIQCAPTEDGPCSRTQHYEFTRCMQATQTRCYEPGEFAGLYVMFRASRGERSDAGWSYATVSPSGEVTASGVIETCAGCHRSAGTARVFGLRREH